MQVVGQAPIFVRMWSMTAAFKFDQRLVTTTSRVSWLRKKSVADTHEDLAVGDDEHGVVVLRPLAPGGGE